MSPELAWSRLDGEHCLRISGWSARERARLERLDERGLAEHIVVLPTSLAGASAGDDDTPIATTRLARAPGRYRIDAEGLAFVPRFPFLAGTAYTVLVHPALCGTAAPEDPVDVAEYRRFTLEPRRGAGSTTTVVTAVHPSGDTVPRNLLRCYVQFSAPMSEGDAAECVHLVDRARREPIPGAFLDMDPELWDPTRTRLTVFLDPARIKRGLAPHREAGYALAEGAEVALVVDGRFRDADGRPLVAGSQHRYRVGPDLRGRVDPETWELDVPSAGSRDPLVVAFGRPLDHALLRHRLRVDGADGAPLPGEGRSGQGDTAWSFTPAAPWRPVRHDLVADAMLEDVAGNSVVRVFDRDLADASQAPVDAPWITRGFTPAP